MHTWRAASTLPRRLRAARCRPPASTKSRPSCSPWPGLESHAAGSRVTLSTRSAYHHNKSTRSSSLKIQCQMEIAASLHAQPVGLPSLAVCRHVRTASLTYRWCSCTSTLPNTATAYENLVLHSVHSMLQLYLLLVQLHVHTLHRCTCLHDRGAACRGVHAHAQAAVRGLQDRIGAARVRGKRQRVLRDAATRGAPVARQLADHQVRCDAEILYDVTCKFCTLAKVEESILQITVESRCKSA